MSTLHLLSTEDSFFFTRNRITRLQEPKPASQRDVAPSARSLRTLVLYHLSTVSSLFSSGSALLECRSWNRHPEMALQLLYTDFREEKLTLQQLQGAEPAFPDALHGCRSWSRHPETTLQQLNAAFREEKLILQQLQGAEPAFPDVLHGCRGRNRHPETALQLLPIIKVQGKVLFRILKRKTRQRRLHLSSWMRCQFELQNQTHSYFKPSFAVRIPVQPLARLRTFATIRYVPQPA